MGSLTVTPPILVPWLSDDEKKSSVVLLDVEVDAIDAATLRFDLNVIFNDIPVVRGMIQKADFFIGTSGGEVTLQLADGYIKGHTQAQSLPVNYENTSTRTRQSSFSLTPEASSKSGATESSWKLGALSWEAGSERSFRCGFASEERVLTPIRLGNILKWVVSLPRGEKAIRDFLLGNLYLFVECAWKSDEHRAGRIVVHPTDVRFFNGDRRPIGKTQSLAMQYCMWRQGIKVVNRQGVDVMFEVPKWKTAGSESPRS